MNSVRNDTGVLLILEILNWKWEKNCLLGSNRKWRYQISQIKNYLLIGNGKHGVKGLEFRFRTGFHRTRLFQIEVGPLTVPLPVEFCAVEYDGCRGAR